MKTYSSAAVAALALAANVWAQSFNVDINAFGADVPPAQFGAAAGQPGTWNAVSVIGKDYPLTGLDGFPSGVELQTDGAGTAAYFDDSNANGNFADLMEDMVRIANADDSLFLTFVGLEAGPYFVFTYADYPDSSEKDTRVTINLSLADNVGGTHNTNEFIQGVTHARRLVHLQPGGPISIRISGNPDVHSSHGVVNGIQVQQLATRLYANDAAPAGGDGLTWDTAFQDLQDAVELARDWAGAVEEIWVAQGTYYPTSGTDQAAEFQIPNGVAMYGGFAGGESSLEERDPGNHPTVLSGNIGGPLPGDNSNNVMSYVANAGAESDALVDGFTIIGGDGSLGAGLLVSSGNPTIRHCRFINNRAQRGGAVFAFNGTPTFIGCEFLGNTATSTGGAYANEAGFLAGATFINCRFHNNDADIRGGAVDAQAGTTTFVNSIFTGSDTPGAGGAIDAANEGTVVYLYDCSLAGNRTSASGGAIAVGEGALAHLSNSILWDNHGSAANEGTMQSQIAISQASAAVSYSTIQFYFSLVLPGIANNGLDPQFVDPTGGDSYGDLNDNLHLSPGSPMIDSGNNNGVPLDSSDLDGDGMLFEPTPYDLDGAARLVDDPATSDTGNGAAPLVDRGAYEFAVCSPLGDLDGDGIVALPDYAILSSHLGMMGGAYGDGDLNLDGNVNLLDFASMQLFFGSLCQ